MATYKGILGQTVQSLASDITASAGTEGQVWYNSTSNVWKMVGYNTGSWSAAPTMAQGRTSAAGAPMGTNSAALVAGGPGPLNYQYTMYAEEFNGTSWTEQSNLNAGRSSIGTCGTAAAAVYNGGHNLTPGSGLKITELWNGTSFTAGNASNDIHKNCGGGGTQTAGIIAGGPGATNEFFNGTTWTEENDTGSPTPASCMNGTQAEAFLAGGSPYIKTAFAYDGTSWAAVTDMGTDRENAFMLGGDPNTNVVVATGMDAPGSYTQATEIWNGTSWSTGGNTINGRDNGGCWGTGTAGGFAGGGPGNNAQSEHWATGFAVQTLTTD